MPKRAGFKARTVEAPTELMEAIERLARDDNRSVNQVIVRILQDYITRREGAGEDERSDGI